MVDFLKLKENLFLSLSLSLSPFWVGFLKKIKIKRGFFWKSV
jgi:hypothetical protein